MATYSGANWTIFDSFREWEGDGTFDMNSDTFNMTLHPATKTFTASTATVYADVDGTEELSTANGYTVGGTAVTIGLSRSGVEVLVTASSPQWTASVGSIQAKYAVIRKVATANSRVGPLVAFVDLDAFNAAGANGPTATVGNKFTVNCANGIYKKTGG